MKTAEELTCKELVEQVTAYLEGTMPHADREVFEGHLYICPGCRIYLEQMSRIIVSLGTLTEEQFGPQERADLLYLFDEWHEQRVR